MKNKRKYLYLILYLISFLVFYNFPFREVFKWDFLPGREKTEAAQVTIDSTVTTTANALQRTPNVVFLGTPTVPSTGIGYAFGVDSDGTCVYWKTLNSGVTWASAVKITNQTDCLGTTVWYDQWTPGDTTGNYIHIVFAEQGGNHLYYQRLDTTNDSLLGETIADTVQSATLLVSNSISITKGTDGILYLGTSDTSDSYVVKCSSSCGTAGNWSEVGTNPMDADEDEIILRPLASGNMMLVNWDISAEKVRSKVWNGSSWDASWSNIIAARDIGASLKHDFDVTLNLSNNNLYFCTGDTTTFAIYTGIYNGSSWSTTTATIAATKYGCSINFDPTTNKIWLTTLLPAGGPLGQRVASYVSSDYMSSWTSVNALLLSNDVYPINSNSMNLIGSLPYVIGHDGTNDDLLGNVDNNLIQSSWRFQNDNNAPNSNTNMANATTSISNVKIGQRITARMQLENYGSAATTSIFSLQFTTGVPTSSSTTWTEVGPWTAISYATGTAANAAAITSQVAGAPTGFTWANGTWHEATSTTNSFTITNAYYTEFAFMIHTANAAENTTYYLRLYNKKNNQPLNSYLYYPTLTTVSSATQRYSLDALATVRAGSSDLNYYFDDLEYTRSSSSDNIYASTTASASTAPFFMFVQKNSNSTDQISPSWEGQSGTACNATKYVVLEAYNFNVSGWQSQATSTTCSVNTDFTLTTTITTNISNYYSSNWTYWRVWQNSASSQRFLTDQIAFTFTSAGALSLTAPSAVTFSSYTIGGSGVSQYTFATSTEQVIVTDSGIGNGWTLSGSITDWTSGSYTISKSKMTFQSDGATSTEPTLIFSNNSYLGISEGTDNQSFSGSVTLMTASGGEGIGIGSYYLQPTFDLYISSTSTYSANYVATMTLTLAYRDNNSPPLFKTVWQRLKEAFNKPTKQFLEFHKLASLTDYNLPLDFRRLAIKPKVIA